MMCSSEIEVTIGGNECWHSKEWQKENLFSAHYECYDSSNCCLEMSCESMAEEVFDGETAWVSRAGCCLFLVLLSNFASQGCLEKCRWFQHLSLNFAPVWNGWYMCAKERHWCGHPVLLSFQWTNRNNATLRPISQLCQHISSIDRILRASFH